MLTIRTGFSDTLHLFLECYDTINIWCTLENDQNILHDYPMITPYFPRKVVMWELGGTARKQSVQTKPFYTLWGQTCGCGGRFPGQLQRRASTIGFTNCGGWGCSPTLPYWSTGSELSYLELESDWTSSTRSVLRVPWTSFLGFTIPIDIHVCIHCFWFAPRINNQKALILPTIF